MTEQHPITPPDELVQQWREKWKKEIKDNAITPGIQVGDYIATQAVRWGADQELEACVEWMRGSLTPFMPDQAADQLRAARRPKPPSLAEQALEACDRSAFGVPGDRDTIRAALERLQELESQ